MIVVHLPVSQSPPQGVMDEHGLVGFEYSSKDDLKQIQVQNKGWKQFKSNDHLNINVFHLVGRGWGGWQDNPGQTTLLRWTPSPQLVEHWVDMLSIRFLFISLNIQFCAFLYISKVAPGPTERPARSWTGKDRGSSSLQTPAESSGVDTCHHGNAIP